MPQVSPFKRPVYYLFKLTYMWEALHLANITIMWLGVYYRSALNHEIRPLNHEIQVHPRSRRLMRRHHQSWLLMALGGMAAPSLCRSPHPLQNL